MSDLDLVPELLERAAAAERANDPTGWLLLRARDFAELGALELTARIAIEAERTQPPAGRAPYHLSEVARLHAMIGRREDAERLAAATEAAMAGETQPYASLAVAFEYLGDAARADAYIERLPVAERVYALPDMVNVSARAHRLERAEQLVERPELRAESFRHDLARLRLTVARGHETAGDHPAALRWLDRAAELLGPPKDYYPNVEIATLAAELGNAPRALEIARAVDRATRDPREPYASPGSLDLAAAFAAAGDQKKVDKILKGYVTFVASGTAYGFARAALACARFGRTRGVAKLLRDAEKALPETNILDVSRGALATAYATKDQFVPALVHTAAIVDLHERATTLLSLARLVQGRHVEATPELTAALASLA